MPGMTSHRTTERHAAKTGRDHLWVLAVIAVFALFDVWGGWTEIGNKSGFAHGTGWTLTVIVEAYWGYALYAWLAAAPGPRSRKFAMWSAGGVFILSLIGQGASRLTAHKMPPDAVVVFVSALPVIVLGLIAILIHLRQIDRAEVAGTRAAEEATSNTEAEAGPGVTPEPEQPVTPAVTAPAAKQAAPVTQPRVTPTEPADTGEGPRRRSDEEWLKEIRGLYADQGDTLSVRKLMPQLKLIGGGKGIAIDRASEMLRTVKAEAQATAGADDGAEAVG